MACRMILVGAGGFGEQYCRDFLPANLRDGTVEVVAAVARHEESLGGAREHLGLPAEKCYTDLERALNETPADCVAVVTPAATHEQVIDAAIARKLHIFCEKPIADTLEDAVRIAEKVGRAGLKMGVAMTHRFRQDITSLREQIKSARYGNLDYLVCSLTAHCRKAGSLGKMQHEMPDPLLIDGAVHHLDLLADMAGGLCETIYAQAWNPRGSEFSGNANALVVMKMANGTRANYEGALANAAGLHWWTNEYIRAECELGTLVLDHGGLEVFEHDPGREPQSDLRPGQGTRLPLIERPKWGNAWLVEKFCTWLDGGAEMETHVEANLQSVAMVFAAVESGRTGEVVRVQEFLRRRRGPGWGVVNS